ncbi:MAG: copper resistance CopC/CopD family protein [Acidimicrobiia bacterium]
MVLAPPVAAHSFLVDTRPGQGERLIRSPSEVVFQFTEAVVAGSAQVELTGGDGASVPTGRVEVESDSRVLRVPLAEPVEGVVVVSWHVVSAVDGHESAGELAFAVGEAGRLPSTTGSQATDTGETVWRWVLVGGLSFGVGGLVASTSGQISRRRGVAWGRLGLALGALGPTVVYLQAITGGFSEGSIAAGAAGLLLALAALAVGRTRRGLAAPALVVIGIVAWASRSHATTANGALGTIADAAHLGGAAFWFGTLTLLVVDLWRTRGQGVTLLETARRYAGWALRAVIILAAAGVISAFSLLTAVSDMWSTDYGRLLITKIVLFGLALALAAASRWRALGSDNLNMLRRLTSIEVVLVAGIVASSGLLAGTPPPALAATEAALLGPPPIDGPVARGAGLAGNMTVGIQAGEGRLDLLVYNSSTGGIDDASLEASATLPDGTGLDLRPRPCGAGCYTQQLQLPPGVTTITVTADSDDWTSGTVNLDLPWPPPPLQPELLDRVITAMRAVEQLTLTETVSSGPGAEATSTANLSGGR